MKTILRDDTELAYADYGDESAPVLLLLHGLGADHRMWRPQIEKYPGSLFRLLVPDLRGFGQSATTSRITLEDWVTDLQALLEAESVADYTLIGVSMGGVIAQALACKDLERLSQLILCDTFMDLEGLRERMVGWAALQGLRLYSLFGRERLASAIAGAYEDSSEAQEYFLEAVRQCDMDHVIEARRAINAVEHKEQLAKLEVPTLQLVGAEAGDFFVSLNQKIVDTMPDNRLVVLPNGMDPSNLVAPEEFDDAALSFLRGADGS